ncbi:class I SAM-dependent methyltransferase [Pseudomonas gingeri]|uniref:class I SAM-dependent methyltransferase n=1 Tax=Pseudomonas gingeri TaxID=117681 RepID=UPI0015A12673|nr:class I SAM-dependent methyltransferase [Pseudomonas gingeri]NWA04459.1 methyltransferase domain-containing protein [Pseudomonas gingeri]NWA15564.1 methyltransferase domain-containing protein [Pseudomonas gingeri]NWA58264.1 methyltransferase domain-containing protein [Pseudomonas gingeri]NWA96060.1 methyltransferase domain-containing protein [Pseudomonas gingeri]NWB04594.1 methyltransferase domain-containing protein [Pseudomonas gingeri]
MSNYEPILKIEGLPIQQNRVYLSRQEAIDCVTGDIVLVQDPVTGVVHNAAFDPAVMVYDENYQNEQGFSEKFKGHLDHVASIIESHAAGGAIVEVGCGKGRFLELLRSRGGDVVGVDPAYEGSQPYVIKAPFSPSLGLAGEVVVMRHVLEHIPDPWSFLDAICEANGRSGLIYIEVPCLDWIKDNRAWFDIFYEHVNYFRLTDFDRFFEKIIEGGKIFGNQYLYVVADMATLIKPARYKGEVFDFCDGFMQETDRVLAQLHLKASTKVAIWGGASKGVIFAQNLMRDGRFVIDFAIDINPAKQGGFFPVSGLPVFSAEEGLKKLSKGDVILVMNSNYMEEIQLAGGGDFNYLSVDSLD